MAKNKKEMTPEERLAAALVPEEEQPYELPKGWKWVRIGKIFIDVTDSQKKIKQKEYLLKGKWPVIDQGQHFIGGYSDADELIYTDELPVIIFGDHTRNVKYIDFQFIQGADGVKVLKPQSFIYSKFLFWLLKGTPFPSLGYRRHFPVLKKMVAPLPPLDEQQRLVARIESLFAKLDAAKAKVQTVLDSHETRKAALLHDAFAGKLTAKWRKEQGLSLNVWRIEKLENLCEKITCGKTPKNDIAPQGEIPYLKVYNIVNDKIDFQSKPQYIPRDVHETKLKSSRLKPNDVVMNIVGPPLRKIAVIPDTYPEWNMNQAIVRFRPKDDLNYRFLYYALLNPETLDDVIQKTKGVVGQANISITQSRNLKIKLPSLPEQQEIVRILDRLLAREQCVQQAAAETLAAIDSMKQSILARAFRGELGA